MSDQKAQLSDVLVSRAASFRDCLTIMDKHGVASVFVVDEATRLVGVIDENLIRRALVDGADVDAAASVVAQPARTATPADHRAETLDAMRALGIEQLPIVDERGRVVGVHGQQRLMGGTTRDSCAVIMAGGRGTRLAPMTESVPKPMLQVAGRPILERLVLHLVGYGIRRIFLSINHLGPVIEKHFGDGSEFGCSIEYLRERSDRPLGTGGSLRLLADKGFVPRAPLLVLNGDLVTRFSVDELLDAHAAQGVVATIAVSTYQHQVPFGVLEGDQDRLERIIEKPTPSWPVNTGIYAIEPALIRRVPRDELFPMTALFEDCLQRKEPVGLWPLKDLWQDIGRPEELAQARGHC